MNRSQTTSERVYDEQVRTTKKWLAAGTILTTAVGIGGFLLSRYRVCAANQFLVKTGLGIRDMTVAKKGILFPFQQMQIISMNPRSYLFELHHMSKEKVPFNLPVVFTISPANPATDLDRFKNYARNMTNISPQELETTIKSVVHGETRILSAGMTIEEMFSDKDKFKSAVVDRIQTDLNQFGLQICNANIEEMGDLKGNEYFSYRKQKAIEGANNEARVAVAEAKKIGDIGYNERVAETRQRVSQIEAETTKIELMRDRDIAESKKELSVAESQFHREKEIARIEAEMTAKQLEIERHQQVEAKRVLQEMETRRATDLVKAKVEAESTIEKAEGEAEAIRRKANAELYSELKKAEGLKATYETQAWGMTQLLEASGNNPHLLQFYLAQNSDLYVKLAEKMSEGIQGLQPKINIWNTGNGANDEPLSFIKNLMTSIPPMLEVLQTQTNVPFLKEDKK